MNNQRLAYNSRTEKALIQSLEPRRLLSGNSLDLDASFADNGRLEFIADTTGRKFEVLSIAVSETPGAPHVALLGAETIDYSPLPSNADLGTFIERDLLQGEVPYVAFISPNGEVVDIVHRADVADGRFGAFHPAAGGGFWGSASTSGAATSSGNLEVEIRRFSNDLQQSLSSTIRLEGSGPNSIVLLTSLTLAGDLLVGTDLGGTVEPALRLTRYDKDGVELATGTLFGSSIPLPTFGNPQADPEIVGFSKIMRLPDGDLLTTFSVAGVDGSSRLLGGAARFNADGSLDTAFGNEGVLLLRPDADRSTQFVSSWIAPDGRFAIFQEQDDGVADLHVFTGTGERYAGTGFSNVGGPGQLTGPGALQPRVESVVFLPEERVAFLSSYATTSEHLLIADLPQFGLRLTHLTVVEPDGEVAGFAPQADRLEPGFALTAAVDREGSLLLGGFIEELTTSEVDLPDPFADFTQVDAVDPFAAVWSLSFDGELVQNVTLDFEDAPSVLSPAYEGPAGFVVEPTNTTGVGYGPDEGFASRVLSTQDWSGTLMLLRDDSQAFDLTSLDVAGGRWGEAGDLRITGTFADGSTDVLDAAFAGKTLQTVEVNWTGLVGVEITSGGGINNAYGSIDNVVLAIGSDDAGTASTVDFDDLQTGILGKSFTNNGLTFTETTPGGSELAILTAGYASPVLSTTEWAGRIEMTAADGTPFALSSFDYAAGIWANPGDLRVTGFFTDGTSDALLLGFDAKSAMTRTVDWSGLDRVVFDFAGGINSAYGAIDNINVVLGGTPPPPAGDVATFESISPDVYGTVEDAGYRFASLTGDGRVSLLQVLDAGFDSNVLSTRDWGDSILFDRNGERFGLDSLDLAAGRWGEAGDAIITGTFADGSQMSVSAAFSNRTLDTVDLDWNDLLTVRVDFAGGVNNVFGAIDNVRLL
jgi:hypothetical protein